MGPIHLHNRGRDVCASDSQEPEQPRKVGATRLCDGEGSGPSAVAN